MSSAVTVVIPTKNRWPMLQTTMRSVLAQEEVDLAVVVVDDGGSDGTAERLTEQADQRMLAVRHDVSLGVSEARNTGLRHVHSRWVAFLDDDDLWAPRKLFRQLQALAAHPDSRWVCSAAVDFYSDGTITGVQRPPDTGDVQVAMLESNIVPGGGSGVLVDADLVREVGGFDARLSVLADWECWIRVAQASTLTSVSSADVGYRKHHTSMAHDVVRSERELEWMVSRHADLYERHDIDIDRLAWQWYLHGMTRASGDWQQGVRRCIDLYRGEGERRALLHLAGYSLPASLRRRLKQRQLATEDPERHAYVRGWLTPHLGPPHQSPRT